MLELKNIRKAYRVGDIETVALDGINVSFREKEFVAILGASGSGKTTCLNIIGGLDRYTSGELSIKGKKTSDFKDRDWDSYRNNSVGFVFQSYNLIPHLSIVANVELGMTLSGVSKSVKHKKAVEVLTRVGLSEHLHKKPNQLSGGQMQRVAIARALANDPEILLCDEPTGALDSATSMQILELIKELSQDRLVIMVTHNPELAEKFAERIINFKDGKIISDTNPFDGESVKQEFSLKKTKMSFFTALGLSFNNLRTKMGRAFLTALASSIGIIGIALILSLSNGFQDKIDGFESDTMSEFPIIISQNSMSVDKETIEQRMLVGTKPDYPDTDEVYVYDPAEAMMLHTNKLSDEYIDYLKQIDTEDCRSIGYTRLVNMNLLRKVDGEAVPISVASARESLVSGTNTDTSASTMASAGMSSMGISSYPEMLDGDDAGYLETYYDLLAGEYPSDEKGVVLVVDYKNRIPNTTLKNLGFDVEDVESIKFSDIVGIEMKLIPNDDYYQKTDFGTFMPATDYEKMYESADAITIKISGIVRERQDKNSASLNPGIAYSDKLSTLALSLSENSEIVKAQRESDKSVFTMEDLTDYSKEMTLSYLGGSASPYMIMLYPRDFDSKDNITDYLDAYNDKQTNNDDKVIYTDLVSMIASLTSGIMDGITIVLVAFAAVSLIVSLIMISIITYISVLERIKEIGILRALGARKTDITRVFDAETFILGLGSGIIGVIIAWLITFPANAYIENATSLANVAQLKLSHVVILVVVSTILTVLGGHIPAKMASKKDAVEALRTD